MFLSGAKMATTSWKARNGVITDSLLAKPWKEKLYTYIYILLLISDYITLKIHMHVSIYRYVKAKTHSSYHWKGSFLVQQFLGFLNLPQDIFSSCLGCKGQYNSKDTRVMLFECCYLILVPWKAKALHWQNSRSSQFEVPPQKCRSARRSSLSRLWI